MFQKIGLKSNRSEVMPNNDSQVSPPGETSLSFDELVIDRSLSPVKVRIKSARKKQPYISDQQILTELQCEV